MRRLSIVLLAVLVGSQSACLGNFGVRGAPVQTDDAMALELPERSVMVQPSWRFSSPLAESYIAPCLTPVPQNGLYSGLFGSTTRGSLGTRLVGLHPERIELSPGVHAFFYEPGHVLGGFELCAFDIEMQPGHVYRPKVMTTQPRDPDECPAPLLEDGVCPWTVELSDTAPDGEQTMLRRVCNERKNAFCWK